MKQQDLIAAGYKQCADGQWRKINHAGSNTGTSSFPPVNRSSDPASSILPPEFLGQKPSKDSPTLLRTQGAIESNENYRVLSGTKPERIVRHEPLAATREETENPSCRKVRITSYRKRLIDPDNLCPKYFIDALRYEGLIEDDTAKHITLEVRQEKSDNPRTEITIE